MNYPVHVKKADILILDKNVEALLKRILKNQRAVGEAYRIKNFIKLETQLKLVEIVKNTWGFLFKPDKKNKNIIGDLEYVWEKQIADEFDFMKIIAPFVEKNSYVVMFSDKGDTWRYFFNGTDCKLQLPEIRWLTIEKEKNENRAST